MVTEKVSALARPSESVTVAVMLRKLLGVSKPGGVPSASVVVPTACGSNCVLSC